MRQPAMSFVLLGISPLVGSVLFTVTIELREPDESAASSAVPHPATMANVQHTAATDAAMRRARCMMALWAISM